VRDGPGAAHHAFCRQTLAATPRARELNVEALD
jgi:hypothetical protein